MNAPIFITGIGTGVGKTVIAAVITEALKANYWKPIQAGFDEGTDSAWVKQTITNKQSKIFPEVYTLKMPASPHIAAREEGINISLEHIRDAYQPYRHEPLIIEGAGGLLVPINEHEFMIDLIKALNAKLILVSRNYLGSINHSLLTANVCRQNNLPVLGWVFNDNYLHYEEEIVEWSGYPRIGSVPFYEKPDKEFIKKNADALAKNLADLV